MGTAVTSKKDTKKYINMVIVLLFMFLFRYIPPISTLTPTGMHVLGVFIGAVYGWSTVGLIWPGFFAIISMSFITGYNLNSIIAGGFGSSTFWIILFMLMFVSVKNMVIRFWSGFRMMPWLVQQSCFVQSKS